LSDGMPGVDEREPGSSMGGGIEELRCGALVGGFMSPIGGPTGGAEGPPLALLFAPGGPLGGGGVAVGRSDSVLAPPFLLTHLPRSGS
jgi:hypothetical protein